MLADLVFPLVTGTVAFLSSWAGYNRGHKRGVREANEAHLEYLRKQEEKPEPKKPDDPYRSVADSNRPKVFCIDCRFHGRSSRQGLLCEAYPDGNEFEFCSEHNRNHDCPIYEKKQ